MRKICFTLAMVITAAATLQAQVNPRKLLWSRTGTYVVSNTNQFTQSSNWGGFTPQNNDTLYINGGSVNIQGSVSLSSLSNIVLLIGAPGSGNSTYTLGITQGTTSFTLSATSAISVENGRRIYVEGSGSNRTRQFLIGSVVKFSNFGASANQTVTGPTQATAATPAATAGNPDGGFILGALPVVLVSFDAAKQGNGVVLNWKTQQEYNTREFQIEKSTDGRFFTGIATVAAAGNATTPRTYSYTDNAGVKGITYYRIRIVDLDNKSGITPVKAVRATAAAVKLGVYPNPAVSVANIVVNNPESLSFSVNVFNRNGQLVAQRRAAAGTTALALDVNGFTAGDYLVDVQFSNGSRESAKLVVARQ